MISEQIRQKAREWHIHNDFEYWSDEEVAAFAESLLSGGADSATVGELCGSCSQWVACSERLPEPEVVVIVSGGLAYRNHNGFWYTITAEKWPGKRIEWKVNHWRPFPKAPASGPEREGG